MEPARAPARRCAHREHRASRACLLRSQLRRSRRCAHARYVRIRRAALRRGARTELLGNAVSSRALGKRGCAHPAELPEALLMMLIPAIDLRDGRVVRSRKGDFDAETTYSPRPEDLLVRYAALGAGW